MLKRHMLLLHVDRRKFPTNRFVGNFYPLQNEQSTIEEI
jgi:hypothetical protein